MLKEIDINDSHTLTIGLLLQQKFLPICRRFSENEFWQQLFHSVTQKSQSWFRGLTNSVSTPCLSSKYLTMQLIRLQMQRKLFLVKIVLKMLVFISENYSECFLTWYSKLLL